MSKSKMYKIVRYVPQDFGAFGGGMIGAKKYRSFEAAKKAMYETIVEKYKTMDEKCAELIDAYCAKYYPQGAPENFNMLKQFLKDYLNNPATLDFEEKYSGIDFEDKYVSFALSYEFLPDGIIRSFYINVKKRAKWKFPEGAITTLTLDKLTSAGSERFVSLTAGKNFGLDVALSLLTEEDEKNICFEN